MQPAAALQLMHLHHKRVHWREATVGDRLLPGETSDLRSAKTARLYRAKLAADAAEILERETERLAARLERAAPPVVLPDLGQVTGWSEVDPEAVTHGDRAMFGGWTSENLTDAQREEALRRAHEARPVRRGGVTGREAGGALAAGPAATNWHRPVAAPRTPSRPSAASTGSGEPGCCPHRAAPAHGAAQRAETDDQHRP